MTINGWLQILFFFALILAVTKPLGVFMAHVFTSEKTFLDLVLRPVERLIYKLTGVNEEHEMHWTEYTGAMLLFSAASMLVLSLIRRLQGHLPLNPQHLRESTRTEAARQLSEHRTRFDANFQKASNNITEIGEPEALQALRRDHDAYYQMFDAFLAGLKATEDTANAGGKPYGKQEAVDRTEYFSRLEPQFNNLRADCDYLLQLNQRAMLAKSEVAAGVARRWFILTLLFDGVLVAAGTAFAFFLADRIVRPLRQLTESTARIAGGNLNEKVEVTSHDEVGVLAAEYNRMAERIRQLRQSDLGQLVVAQQTTEAAIDSLYDPVIVTNEAGCITKLITDGRTLAEPLTDKSRLLHASGFAKVLRKMQLWVVTGFAWRAPCRWPP